MGRRRAAGASQLEACRSATPKRHLDGVAFRRWRQASSRLVNLCLVSAARDSPAPLQVLIRQVRCRTPPRTHHQANNFRGGRSQHIFRFSRSPRCSCSKSSRGTCRVVTVVEIKSGCHRAARTAPSIRCDTTTKLAAFIPWPRRAIGFRRRRLVTTPSRVC